MRQLMVLLAATLVLSGCHVDLFGDRHPSHTFAKLVRDNPDVTWAREASDEELEELGLLACQMMDHYTHPDQLHEFFVADPDITVDDIVIFFTAAHELCTDNLYLFE